MSASKAAGWVLTMIFLQGLGTGHETYAGLIRHDRDDSLYLALAHSDPAFDAVGRFDRNSLFRGSGTIIDSQWVLTSAHVVDTSGFTPDKYSFTVGGSVYTAAQIVIHPDWTPGWWIDKIGFDLALVRLASPVTNVAPAILNTRTDEMLDWQRGQVLRVGTNVGFGGTGTGLTGGDPNSGGTKRAGQNAVYGERNGDPGVLTQDFDDPRNRLPYGDRQGALDLEYMVWSGDSGGGLFMDFGQGMVLAGVHSGVSNLGGGYFTEAWSTRVSQQVTWIQSVIGGTAVVPEPSSLLMLGVGAIAGAAAVRRNARAAKSC